jgi:hypothetical protein
VLIVQEAGANATLAVGNGNDEESDFLGEISWIEVAQSCFSLIDRAVWLVGEEVWLYEDWVAVWEFWMLGGMDGPDCSV